MGLNTPNKTHEYKVTIFTKNGGKYAGFAYSHISDPILFNKEFFSIFKIPRKRLYRRTI